MKKLLATIWPRFAEQPPQPVPPSAEEQRKAADAKMLAEFRAFDDAVGAAPTQETLKKRFEDAVLTGHTRVVVDTLEKGLSPCPDQFTRYSHPVIIDYRPLKVAAQNEWADMAEALLKASSGENLAIGLTAAEEKKNVGIARAIRGE